jgi:hypothetical protein
MARKLIVEIVGDTSKLEKAFKTAGRDAEGFAHKTQSLGSRVAKAGLFAGAAAGLGALTVATKAGVSEFLDSQKVAAQTAAVLKSTGGAAGVTAKQIDDLAGAMLNKSGIDDEVIKSGENLLLTFRNIRNETGKGNDIFNQATQAATDMSVALGQDMSSSAIQLGKALNDPIKGVTALRRVGVSFTKEQTDMINKLVESGRSLDAQKLILGELRKEFGGSARAAGKTFGGQINILRETLNNLAGEIVGTLMPTFQKLLARANKWITNAQNQKKVVDAAKQAIGAITGAIQVLVGAFNTLSRIVGGNRRAIVLLVAAYGTWKVLTIAGNVATLAGRFGLLAGNTTKAAGATRGLSASMLGKAGLVVGVGAAAFAITSLILKMTGLDEKLKSVGASAYDAAAKIGLVHDPGAQFAGHAAPGQASAVAIRAQARRLEAGGMSPAQAAARILARRPDLARHDVEVLAGVYGGAPGSPRRAPARPGGVTVHGDLHVHGVQDPRKLQDAVVKQSRGRPVRRRGDP